MDLKDIECLMRAVGQVLREKVVPPLRADIEKHNEEIAALRTRIEALEGKTQTRRGKDGKR